jgi:oligoendopeptidase F
MSAKKKPKALPGWDLSALYAGVSDSAIARDLAALEKKAATFAKRYQGKLATSLAEAIADYEQLQEGIGKLGSFAQLVYAADMRDPAITQFYQNTSEALTRLSSRIIFFTLEINKLSDAAVKAALAKSKTLARYKPWIDTVRAYKNYQLSDELEHYIHETSVIDGAWQRLFDETVARLHFTMEGKQVGSAEIFDYLSHKDGKKRKEAAKEIARVFEENSALFALITNTLANAKYIDDKKRGFKSGISSRNISNQVEDAVVDALIATVKKNYSHLSHRYYAWKAKQFKRKSLDYWDRNAPLPAADEADFAWGDAVTLVQEAYHAFSPDLARVGKRFFDENWIDVPVRPGKSPGAFAHPTVPSAHPYLLLNYQGKTRDVMTLAHELGHGVHQVLSNKQGALMCDTPLTLAETASVFGEMLTFQELLKREKNKTRRQRLIAGKVEDMLNTVVRQIAFCEFERMVHAQRREGELSVARIGEIWMQVQRESLGPAIQLHPEYHVYWMYIPHFIHSPFYVYAYAFGDCLVNSLYGVYLKEEKAGRGAAFAKKYHAMLEAGGTLRHKELLKPFGLDASKPDFWQQGLDVIAGYIKELGA